MQARFRVLWMLGAALWLAACASGAGGSDEDSNPLASGLTANFVGDASPVCPGNADTLSLRRVNAVGRNVAVGIAVTDCDASMGIYGVVFDVTFDPSIMQCASSNPCMPGTLLSQPLLTSNPQCTCNNTTGEILGVFTRKAPGTNESVAQSGIEDIVQFVMRINRAGVGRIDLAGTGDVNGTALVALSGSSPSDPPAAIAGLAYSGGSAVGQ
ncbi:MAG TPA: hypothetical protein VGK94_09840 [Candidatus Polarisedimenticolia bacterium]|jgi:hypothetical protein